MSDCEECSQLWRDDELVAESSRVGHVAKIQATGRLVGVDCKVE